MTSKRQTLPDIALIFRSKVYAYRPPQTMRRFTIIKKNNYTKREDIFCDCEMQNSNKNTFCLLYKSLKIPK